MLRFGQADKLREIADGWPPSFEKRLISLLGTKAIQKLEISILTFKTCVYITLGMLLPIGPLQQDGLDFVHPFMKWLGHWFRDRHAAFETDCMSCK